MKAPTGYTSKNLQHAELLGVEVTYHHPSGDVTAPISRVSDSSIWATFTHPTNGNQLTYRFTQRINGQWRMHGKGEYSPALVFAN